MPVESCNKDGKPGFKACPSCACFTYTPRNDQSRRRARARAERQLRAIKASQARRNG